MDSLDRPFAVPANLPLVPLSSMDLIFGRAPELEPGRPLQSLFLRLRKAPNLAVGSSKREAERSLNRAMDFSMQDYQG